MKFGQWPSRVGSARGKGKGERGEKGLSLPGNRDGSFTLNKRSNNGKAFKAERAMCSTESINLRTAWIWEGNVRSIINSIVLPGTENEKAPSSRDKAKLTSAKNDAYVNTVGKRKAETVNNRVPRKS